MFVFCKIPISIPINIETSIHLYFVRRYSVRCWYRVPVYSPYDKGKGRGISLFYIPSPMIKPEKNDLAA